MELGLTLDWWSDEDLIFARQLGIGDVLCAGDGLSRERLAGGARRARASGLSAAAAEFRAAPSVFDIPGEEDFERGRIGKAIADAAHAAIPIVSLAWGNPSQPPLYKPLARGEAEALFCQAPTGVAHGGESPPRIVREDATARDRIEYIVTHWANVAADKGVKLALAPMPPWLGPIADPTHSENRPIESLSGVDGLLELLERIDNPHLCVDLHADHLAASLAGDEFMTALERLLATGRVVLARLGKLERTVDASGFHGDFIDRDERLTATLRSLHASGFKGIVRPGYTPRFVGDTQWGHAAHAYAAGLLKALLKDF